MPVDHFGTAAPTHFSGGAVGPCS